MGKVVDHRQPENDGILRFRIIQELGQGQPMHMSVGQAGRFQHVMHIGSVVLGRLSRHR